MIMKTQFFSSCLLMAAIVYGASAPVNAGGGTTAKTHFRQAQLDQVMAPIALYPDSLLSQVLMAATYPDQVVEAVKWSKKHPGQDGDKAVKAVHDKHWEPSVASLVAFPQVLDMMGAKPDWVRELGDAFLAEPGKVMHTTQELRAKARDNGKLETTKQQKVIVDKSNNQTIIKIEPSSPDIVYVPTYNPSVVYGSWWWPSYPPFYYYPPGYGFATGVMTGIGFGVGIGISNALWGNMNWHNGNVRINVNHYNNININHRLNVGTGSVQWNHRNIVNNVNRNNFVDNSRHNNIAINANRRNIANGNSRDSFRGRDAERQRAESTLRDHGIDPAAERRRLSGSDGTRVRNQLDRGGLLDGSHDRGRIGDGGFGDKRASGLFSGREGQGLNGLDNDHREGGHALSGIGDDHWGGGLADDRGQFSNRLSGRDRDGGFRDFSGFGSRDRFRGGGFGDHSFGGHDFGGRGFGGFHGHFGRR